MSKNFDRAIDFVFAVEGYVSNNKADKGGYTKYGIAQASHPSVDVKNLTIDGAKAIYKKQYWDACRCDEFSGNVGLYLMDFAVNSGVKTAAVALQKCVNRLLTGKNDAPLAADGKIGPKTIEAAKQIEASALVAALHAYRTAYFFGIVKRNPSQQTFLKGWMNRLAKLHMYAGGVKIERFGCFV